MLTHKLQCYTIKLKQQPCATSWKNVTKPSELIFHGDLVRETSNSRDLLGMLVKILEIGPRGPEDFC